MPQATHLLLQRSARPGRALRTATWAPAWQLQCPYPCCRPQRPPRVPTSLAMCWLICTSTQIMWYLTQTSKVEHLSYPEFHLSVLAHAYNLTSFSSQPAAQGP